MRVLVSGGEFELRDGVATALRGAGVDVSEAAGAPEALRLLSSAEQRKVPFTLVVDLAGGLAARVAEVFPGGAPPVRGANGPGEALAALRACGK